MAEVDFQRLTFEYRRCADQAAVPPARHPVAVVGAGPVGLSLAIDLAQRNVPVVLLDNDNTLSTGSRAICFAKRTLEIFDHCLPFDVTRAHDEATKYRDPRIWTAQRDKEMWEALEG